VPAAVEGVEGVETARLRVSWGRVGSTDNAEGTASERGVSLRVAGGGGAVDDVGTQGEVGVVICDAVGAVGGSRCRTGVKGASWGRLGLVGSERGVSPGVDSVVSDAAGVWDTGGGETGRLRPYWGELCGWDVFGGRSGVPRCVLRRS
jgi:hypothetical protein